MEQYKIVITQVGTVESVAALPVEHDLVHGDHEECRQVYNDTSWCVPEVFTGKLYWY